MQMRVVFFFQFLWLKQLKILFRIEQYFLFEKILFIHPLTN